MGRPRKDQTAVDSDLSILHNDTVDKETGEVQRKADIYSSYSLVDIMNHPTVIEANAFVQQPQFTIGKKILSDIVGLTAFSLVKKDTTTNMSITTRPVPVIFETSADLDKLLPLIESVQAYRDFVFQRQVKYTILKRDIETISNKVFAFLYQFDVINKFKTVDQRRAVVEDICSPIVQKLKDIQNVLDACNLANENLKAAGFALHEMSTIALRSVDYKMAFKSATTIKEY